LADRRRQLDDAEHAASGGGKRLCAATREALDPGLLIRFVADPEDAAGASAAGAPGAVSLRVLRFSTTTDFERPWLKLCRTWPDSTVR
jgi:hypothetical protein